jgi:hypothetical protein
MAKDIDAPRRMSRNELEEENAALRRDLQEAKSAGFRKDAVLHHLVDGFEASLKTMVTLGHATIEAASYSRQRDLLRHESIGVLRALRVFRALTRPVRLEPEHAMNSFAGNMVQDL